MKSASVIKNKLTSALTTAINLYTSLFVFDYKIDSKKKRSNLSTDVSTSQDTKVIKNLASPNETSMYNSQMHVLRNIFSGSIAGVTVAYTTFPLEARKKWKQSGQTAKFNWYRGSTVFAANIVPTTTIQFLTDQFLKQFLPINASLIQNVTASIVCGFTGAITSTFVENAIVRQQVLNKGPVHAIRDMLNVSLLRPWKTYPCIAARDGIFTFSMFWAMPEASKWCKNNAPQYELIVPFTISCLGASISHPLDTIATRMQMTHKKESAIKIAKSLIKNDGYKGLYKGFSYRFALFTIFSNGLPVVNKWYDEKIGDKLFTNNQTSIMKK